MSNKETGGPAFPFAVYVGGDAGIVSNDECDMGGMTLRDYFAAKAMNYVLHDWKEAMNKGGETFMPENVLTEDLKLAAMDCYLIADAMLEARNAN